MSYDITYEIVKKYLVEYRYDRYFLKKQFYKFLDKKKCKSMYQIIMKYHMPYHVEYLTTLYMNKCNYIIKARYLCDEKIFHNIVYRNLLNIIWIFLNDEIKNFIAVLFPIGIASVGTGIRLQTQCERGSH